jgi:hypothetical protein
MPTSKHGSTFAVKEVKKANGYNLPSDIAAVGKIAFQATFEAITELEKTDSSFNNSASKIYDLFLSSEDNKVATPSRRGNADAKNWQNVYNAIVQQKQDSWINASADNKLENLQFEERTLFRTIKSFKETCSRFSKLATMGLFEEFDAIVRKGTKYKKDTKYTLQLSNDKDYQTTSLVALLNKLVSVKEQAARTAEKFKQEQDIKEEKEALKSEGLTDDQIANVSFYGEDNHMICPSLKSLILCLSEFSLTEQEEMLSQLPLAMRKNEKGKYVPLNIVKALELHTNAKA